MNRKREQLASQEVEAFPHFQNELALQQQGYRFIAGLDEAGRGAWAGPVIAAAVILPAGSSDLETTLCGVQDSKKLTPNRRQHLFDIVTETALAVGIGSAPPGMIDEVNVIGATRYAMQQAVENLSLKPDFLLIDHLKLPEINIPQHAFAKAIDIAGWTTGGGEYASVNDDWEIDPEDEPTCEAETETEKDRLLHEVICELKAARVWNIVLTPNYNAAHRDHFHVDLKEGSDYIRSGRLPVVDVGPDDY